MTNDLALLFEPPEYSAMALLTIQALAPLSMVNSMPGSYYKTEHVPTKFMLCGLFENILGYHLCEKDRRDIRNKIKNHYQRKHRLKFAVTASPVGYMPIVDHLFEIQPPVIQPELIFFEDFWTQHLIGSDERHLKGVVNYDWSLEPGMVELKEADDSKARSKFFEKHRSQFPLYYRSPQRREFVLTKRPYEFKLGMTVGFFAFLQSAIDSNNIGYLGTSEGWVDVSLEEL